MAKQDLSKGIDNFKNYEEKVKNLSDKELELFNHFYDEIKNRATNHRSATLNNLEESKKSLLNLQAEADKLKDSVFYHDETVIVDRQSIISQTEDLVHNENRNILDYEFSQAGESIDSLDYLNKAMIQTKLNFFDSFRNHYANQILDNDYLYVFFQNKVEDFDKTLNKYHQEILESFEVLDNEINDVDMQINLLIKQKNSELNVLNKFYDQEMKNYLDNQLTFSVEDDASSLTIQALISDKITQLDRFKEHLYQQESKVKDILNKEYNDLYEKTLDRLLKRKGNDLVEDTNFFNHPEEVIFKLKKNIANAKENDFVTLKDLIKQYNKAINYKQEKLACEKKAKQLTKQIYKSKKEIYLEYQLDSRNLIFQLEKYFKMYRELLQIDPFFAQIIGDNSTKIIKDQLNFLSILQVNKEQRINVNFDIKTLKLKQKINQVEAKLAYMSEELMVKQDIELLDTIKDLQLYFVEHQYDSTMIMNSLTKEKFIIERLEKAVSYHMEYLVNESNLNRKFLSIITQILEANIRDLESHNIRLIDATSNIKLALKEYDILALHYNTMYENEKRFLVMQSNRISEESKINNEFILTTFSNQMRFAGEQIALANDEYKLRVEAILTAINEERNYYYDIIDNKMKKYKEKQKVITNDYQAKLYHDSLLIEETSDKGHIKSLEKQIAKNKSLHDNLVQEIELEISKDEIIKDAEERLKELNNHFEVALENAKTIRDDTINEMTELYNDSEKKYNALKPYLESKINPLEPTFFNSLEQMKARHEVKIKAAAAELDVATKNLMDNYLKIYFTENPEINKDLYLSQIDQIEEERINVKKAYSKKLEKNDLVYNNKVKSLENELRSIINKIDNNRNQVINKHQKSINQKNNEIDSLNKHFNSRSEKIKSSSINEILDITQEYNQSILSNEKYYQDLSKAFDNLLKSYDPYLKSATYNKVVKKIIKQTEKKVSKEQNVEFKKLTKASKKPDYLKEA